MSGPSSSFRISAETLFLAASVFFVILGAVFPRALFLWPFIIAALAGGVRLFWGRPFCLPSWPVIAGFAGLAALCLISALWSVDPPGTLSRGVKVTAQLAAALMALGFSLSLGREGGLRRPWLIAAAVMFGAVLVLGEYYSGLAFHRLLMGADVRIPQSTLNRSVVAVALLMFPAAAFMRSAPFAPFVPFRKPEVSWLMLAIPVIAMLAITSSQSAQLAFAAGALTFLFFPVNVKPAWRILQMLLVAGFLAAPWAAMWGFHHLLDLAAGQHWLKKAAAPHRLEIWDFVSRRALESPLYGFGMEATRKTVFETQRLYYPGNTVLHPHNFALQIWIEFGALGAVVVAAGFVCFLESMRRCLRAPQVKYALASFMAWLAVACTGYGLWQSWWLGLGVMMACLILAASAGGTQQDSKENPA